jgi:hypothetical protein
VVVAQAETPDAWVIALVSAAVGALVGGLIAVAWDVMQGRRVERKRDELLALLLVEDLADLSRVLTNMRDRIRVVRELEPDNWDTFMVLPRPSCDVWDILRIGFPAALLDDSILMKHLRTIQAEVGRTRTLVDEREAIRSEPTNGAPFENRMPLLQEMDRNIETRVERLLADHMEQARNGLRAHFPRVLSGA